MLDLSFDPPSFNGILWSLCLFIDVRTTWHHGFAHLPFWASIISAISAAVCLPDEPTFRARRLALIAFTLSLLRRFQSLTSARAISGLSARLASLVARALSALAFIHILSMAPLQDLHFEFNPYRQLAVSLNSENGLEFLQLRQVLYDDSAGLGICIVHDFTASGSILFFSMVNTASILSDSISSQPSMLAALKILASQSSGIFTIPSRRRNSAI